MKPEEKEIYHKQARGPLLRKVEKYTSQGASFSAIEMQRSEKEREILEINLDIDNMLDLAVEQDSKLSIFYTCPVTIKHYSCF